MQLRFSTCIVDLTTGDLSGGREGRLTTRERLLLRRLFEADGAIVSRAQLLQEVWGYAPSVKSRAADQAMAVLRAKVENRDAPTPHLRTIRGKGYRLEGVELVRPWAPGPQLDTGRFWGRESELEALAQVLSRRRGFAALTGPIGIGKSRLAAEAVANALENFPAGLRWVSLEDASDLGEFLDRVTSAFEITVHPPSEEAIGRALAAHGRALAVFDGINPELAETVAPILADWHGPFQGAFLTTSRGSLEVGPATEISLGPLPPDVAAAMIEERGGSREIPRRAQELAAACDGVPQALEAVARHLLDETPVTEIAQAATASEQVRLAVDVAWAALPPEARRNGQQLAVFRAPFTSQDATAVLQIDEFEAWDLLEELAGRGLLIVSRDAGAQPVLRMPTTVREPLVSTVENDSELLRRYARHFARFGDEPHLPRLDYRDRRPPMERFADFMGGYEAAVATGELAVAAANVRVAVRIMDFRGNRADTLELLRETLALELPAEWRLRILADLASTHIEVRWGGESEVEEGLALALAANDQLFIGAFLVLRANLLMRGGRRPEAAECFDHAISALAPLRHPWRVAALMGKHQLLRGQDEAAATQVLDLAARSAQGHGSGVAGWVSVLRGLAALKKADNKTARDEFSHAARRWAALDHFASRVVPLQWLGDLTLAEGNLTAGIEQLQALADECARRGMERHLVGVHGCIVSGLIDAERWPDAAALADRTLASPEVGAVAARLPRLLADRALAAARLGDPEGAHEWLQKATGSTDNGSGAYLTIRRAEIAYVAADVETTAALLLELRNRDNLPLVGNAARALARMRTRCDMIEGTRTT